MTRLPAILAFLLGKQQLYSPVADAQRCNLLQFVLPLVVKFLDALFLSPSPQEGKP